MDDRVAVHRRVAVGDVADHRAARALVRLAVGAPQVVDGGEEVVFRLERADADGVGHVRGGLHAELGARGDHAPEEGEVDGVVLLEDGPHGLGVRLVGQPRLPVLGGRVFGGQRAEAVERVRADQDEGVGVVRAVLALQPRLGESQHGLGVPYVDAAASGDLD